MSVSKSLPASTIQAPTLLLCEALGFSPQILLDDIINIANNAVQDGVNGMEEFLEKWAEERASQGDTATIDSTHEVEQGLVAFQTLLEHHTDIAFDFFEGWSLRNIFHIPPDLPIVLPHQEGLDLTVTSERVQELMDEMEDLRNQLDNVRFHFVAISLHRTCLTGLQQKKLSRLLTRAVRVSSQKRKVAEMRLNHLSHLASSPSVPSPLDKMKALPPKFLSMYQALSTLPQPDRQLDTPVDPGKRQWETNKTGYVNWAVDRLLAKGGADRGGSRAVAEELGTAQELRAALAAVGDVKADLEEAMDES